MPITLFKRKPKRQTEELAPQLTRWERTALETPSPATGGLPYDTYRAMEQDSMIQTALTLKKLGVVASPYSIQPASDTTSAKKKRDFVEEAFARMEGSPLTILLQAMDAFAKGWSIQELVYEEDDQDAIWLRAARPKDPSHFGAQVDRFGRLTGLHLQIAGEDDLDLPIEKFVVHTHRGGYSNPKGKSDLDAVYPHYSAKTSLLSAWKAHLERFATPTMLAAAGTGATQKERNTVLNALNNLATTKAMVFPAEFAISSIPAETEASKGFMDAIDYHNREIARAILGQTLTTDEGRRVGSLALGRVHLQVLLLQLESIRKELADRVMTEQVIRPLVELNFGPGEIPRFQFEPAEVDAFRSGKLD